MLFTQFEEVKGIFVFNRQFGLIADFFGNSLIKICLIQQGIFIGVGLDLDGARTFFVQPNFRVMRM